MKRNKWNAGITVPKSVLQLIEVSFFVISSNYCSSYNNKPFRLTNIKPFRPLEISIQKIPKSFGAWNVNIHRYLHVCKQRKKRTRFI